mmetsp:Transcript_7178/g.6369  ORF Transcript_7178/g.6369 Transcript_7178/m.6369 type:complete len:112 (-) Transcript_7178:180-515(-)
MLYKSNDKGPRSQNASSTELKTGKNHFEQRHKEKSQSSMIVSDSFDKSTSLQGDIRKMLQRLAKWKTGSPNTPNSKALETGKEETSYINPFRESRSVDQDLEELVLPSMDR